MKISIPQFVRVAALLGSLFGTVQAQPLDFEGLSDGTLVTNQFVGFNFVNAVVLTAHESLNEIEFPPSSGNNVIGDTDAPIRIDFVQPINLFGAYFTYTQPLSLQFFGANAQLLATFSSAFTENFTSSAHPPNEFIGTERPLSQSAAFLVITGAAGGSSFVLDDLSASISAVPEPSSLLLLTSGFLAVLLKRTRRRILSRKSLYLIAVFATASGVATAQTLATPVVSPSYVVTATPSQLKLVVRVQDAAVSPGSVIVQEVSASGSVIGFLGPLKDDGTGPDTTAGDNVYSGFISLTRTGSGLVNLRVSAGLNGQIRRVFSPVTSVTVLSIGTPTVVAPVAAIDVVTDPSTNEVIVGNVVLTCFRPTVSDTVAAQVAGTINGALIGRFPAGNCYQIRLASSGGAAVQAAIAALVSDPNVESAQPDQLNELSAVPDICATSGVLPTCTDPAYSMLKLAAAHGEGVTGANTIIAIIDSGIRADNTDINYPVPGYAQRVIKGNSYEPLPLVPVVVTLDDTDGHGSHVAGIASATAPSSRLYAVKVCAPIPVAGIVKTRCSNSGIAAAIDDATALGGVSVINLSLQNIAPPPLVGPSLGVVGNAIRRARFAGIVVVASAGNSMSSTPNYPASFTDVLGVGSVDSSSDLRASNSNFGAWVTLSAPGVVNQGGIQSNGITAGTTAAKGGTSMAAPFVAGAVAMLRGTYTYFSATNIEDQLKLAVIELTPDAAGNANQGLGLGRLDPVAALGAIRLRHRGMTPAIPYTFSLTSAGGVVIIPPDADQLGANGVSCALRLVNYCLKNYLTYKKLANGKYTIRVVLPVAGGSVPSVNFGYNLRLTEPRLRFTGVTSNPNVTFSADRKVANGSLLNFGNNIRNVQLEIEKF